VVAACRIYYTLQTTEVATKVAALEWALRTLHPRWRPLLGQIRDGRSLGWDPTHRPRPGEADAARAFAAYVITQADRADVLRRID
jgi:hypothetical protein